MAGKRSSGEKTGGGKTQRRKIDKENTGGEKTCWEVTGHHHIVANTFGFFQFNTKFSAIVQIDQISAYKKENRSFWVVRKYLQYIHSLKQA